MFVLAKPMPVVCCIIRAFCFKFLPLRAGRVNASIQTVLASSNTLGFEESVLWDASLHRSKRTFIDTGARGRRFPSSKASKNRAEQEKKLKKRERKN